MMKVILILWCEFLMTQYSFGANILFLQSSLSVEENSWAMSIINGLFKEGHNITTLSMFDNEKNGIHFLDLRETRKILTSGRRQDINVFNFADINPWTRSFLDYEFHLEFCEVLMNDSSYKFLLNYPENFKFDLMLFDSLSSPCLLGFHQKFKITKLVGILVNVRESVLFDRSVMSIKGNTNITELSFIERVEEFCLNIFKRLLNERLISNLEDKMLKNFPGIMGLREIIGSEQMLFVNSHWTTDNLEVKHRNVINVAGLNINVSRNEAEQKIQNSFTRIQDGIILFSLGPDVKVNKLDVNLLHELIITFERFFGYIVIWMVYEEIELDEFDFPENIFLSYNKFSQQEILRFPKTKLFITNGDYLSIQESLWFGVPVLGVPIFPQEVENIDQLIKLEVAEKFDIRTVETDDLYSRIKSVLRNEKYSTNMKLRSKAFRDQQKSPLKRALWWINRHLKYPGITSKATEESKMSFIQRYSIDILGFLFITISFPLYVYFKLVMYAIFICHSNKPVRKLKRH